MESFIYTTDWHLSDYQPENRLGDIVEDAFNKVEQIFQIASQKKCPIVHGGDIFDNETPSYCLTNRLIQLIKKYGVTIYTLLGNHDLRGLNKEFADTTIFTLIHSEVIKKLDSLEFPNIVFKGIDYTKSLNVNEFLFEETPKFKVLATHLPIVTKKVPFPHLLTSEIKTNASLVLCGHIHSPFCIKHDNTWFINSGVVVRRRIDEKDIRPKVVHITPKGFEDIYLSEPSKDIFKIREEKSSFLLLPQEEEKAFDIFQKIDSYKVDEVVKTECKRRLTEVTYGH